MRSLRSKRTVAEVRVAPAAADFITPGEPGKGEA
jgi:hypothetical protein